MTEVRPSIGQLFWTSFQLGLFSFGGGLANWIYREFVVKRRWMDERTFHTDFSAARVLPGTNVSNFMVIGGYRIAGLVGSCAALIGLMIPPFAIIIGLALVYDRFSGPVLGHLLEGAAAAAVGLLIPLAARGVRHAGTHWTSLLVLSAVALSVGFLGIPIPTCIAIALPCSIAFVMWRRRKVAR